jgi:SHS2 domain-containing protein
MPPGYRFLEHMTDAEIEASGRDLAEAFENAGKAVEDTMVDIKTIARTEEQVILVEGKDRQDLLYSWLEALINKQDIDGMLYSEFHCALTEESGRLKLTARVSGEKFDRAKHDQKTAIKAPTYHDMKIVESANAAQQQVTLRFLLDL